MIELFEQDGKTAGRQSSKGNQLKWENKDIWYKADYAGYEGLAEYMVSHLLGYSTLRQDEYVLYGTEEIRYKSGTFRGCRSKSLLREGEQLITLERLFQCYYGKSLYESLFAIDGIENRLSFLTGQAQRMTGLDEFGPYMAKLLTLDAVFLNEDRHTHNIAVVRTESGKYRYCPIFDNGAALLSDTAMDYPLGQDPIERIGDVKAKTISESFDDQLDAAEALYGEQVHFSFRWQEIKHLLDEEPYYPENMKERVCTILLQQRRKYQYLFCERMNF